MYTIATKIYHDPRVLYFFPNTQRSRNIRGGLEKHVRRGKSRGTHYFPLAALKYVATCERRNVKRKRVRERKLSIFFEPCVPRKPRGNEDAR